MVIAVSVSSMWTGSLSPSRASRTAYADFPIHDDTMQAVLLETDPEQIREEAATKATSTGWLMWMIASLASAYNAVLPGGKIELPVHAKP
jgi:hypothetical protein